MDNLTLNKNAYNSFANKYACSFYTDWEGKEFVDEFLKTLGTAKSFLDLGCGNGNLANYATSKGYIVKGYDLSENMVKIGKQLNPKLNLNVLDITNLPQEDILYDGAIYCYSFMHLTKTQAKQSLLTLNKNLKQNAVLAIFTCAGAGRAVVSCDDFDKTKKMLFTFYTQEQITKLLNQCGFKVNIIKIKHDDNANISSDDLIVFAQKEKTR